MKLFLLCYLYRCTLVETDHICYRTPEVNFMYQYPENLPGGSLASRTVDVAFIFLSTANPPIPIECQIALQHIMCFGSTPPCSTVNNLLLDVCPNSCKAFNRLTIAGKCSSVFDYVKELQSLPSFEEFVVFLELLSMFDCNNRSTYIYYDDIYVDPTLCTDLFRPGEAG